MVRPVAFVVPSAAVGRRLLGELEARFRGCRGPSRRFSTTWLDTFDGRLHDKGEALTVERSDEQTILKWHAADGTPRHRLPVAAPPGFARELPPCPLREALARRIEMRRLLPRIAVDGSARTVDCRDARDKTVVRVRLERGAAYLPGDGPVRRRLRPVLVVEPLRGYARQADKIAAWLAERDMRETEAAPQARAFAALGLRADAAPRRPELAPEMAAGDAVRRILRWLLAVMRHNEEGLIRDLDSEFLHDFRVAVRRTRAVLGQLRGLFPVAERDRFRTEFAWLGGITGPQRDLDVFLLGLPELRATLGAGQAGALDPLEAFLTRRQREAQGQVAEALGGARYATLLEAWSGFLAAAPPDEPERATRPVRQVADKRIRRAWRRVRDDGRGIAADTPSETLHRLRIDCKKLRYLLEFFAELHAGDATRPLIRSLKRLQDTLGRFNDQQVQQESLDRFAREMGDEGEVPPDTLLAIGRLVEYLRERQRHERLRFAERFARFDSPDHRAVAARLFHGSGTAKR